jgi:hypothetical protein
MLELIRNELGGLDITSQMSGGSLNGTGTALVEYTDTTPNSFAFDTFTIRPSSATGAAQIFDTTGFTVAITLVPEPTTFALVGLGIFGLAAMHRRNRQ